MDATSTGVHDLIADGLDFRRCPGSGSRSANVEAGGSTGTPAFKVKGKPEIFFVTDHYRDYPIVLLRLPRIGRRRLAEVLEEAWRQAAPKRMPAAYDAQHDPGTKRRAT